jgi:hypothetical protein
MILGRKDAKTPTTRRVNLDLSNQLYIISSKSLRQLPKFKPNMTIPLGFLKVNRRRKNHRHNTIHLILRIHILPTVLADRMCTIIQHILRHHLLLRWTPRIRLEQKESWKDFKREYLSVVCHPGETYSQLFRLAMHAELLSQNAMILNHAAPAEIKSSAKTFMDLVNDPPSANSTGQRLRLRVGSRILEPPAKDCHGHLLQEATDPLTGEILYGLNDRYRAREVSFWPPEQNSPWSPEDDRLEEIYILMNPPSHLGNIEAMGDERSFVYATGRKDQPRAIIFASFDPATNLGLKNYQETKSGQIRGQYYLDRWHGETENATNGDKYKDNSSGNQCHKDNIGGRMSKERFDCIPNNGERWIWQERAMHRVIGRGFNFGHRS